MYALISPFTQSFDDVGFTYKIPSSLFWVLKCGHIVHVPFWNKTILWVVIDISEQTQVSESKLKEIHSLYSETIFLNEYQISLLKWISAQYFCLIHAATQLFFPKNLLEKISKNTFSFTQKYSDLSYHFDYKKSLNPSQKEVFDTIINSWETEFLLYWVTGSGKTEVYINLIKYYLDKWEQSLLLVPEIILTNQIFERIKKVFWEEVIILNSTVSEAKKTLYRDLIYTNKAKIIVGTRSAIFYPYNHLWIIIVDEEHDNSYISDNTPRYDGIEVVKYISDYHKSKLVLWSGTPKMNHLYQALQWKSKVLNLFQEYK